MLPNGSGVESGTCSEDGGWNSVAVEPQDSDSKTKMSRCSGPPWRLGSRLATIRELLASQTCCLCHEVILFRDAGRVRSRNAIVFDRGIVVAHFFE